MQLFALFKSLAGSLIENNSVLIVEATTTRSRASVLKRERVHSYQTKKKLSSYLQQEFNPYLKFMSIPQFYMLTPVASSLGSLTMEIFCVELKPLPVLSSFTFFQLQNWKVQRRNN